MNCSIDSICLAEAFHVVAHFFRSDFWRISACCGCWYVPIIFDSVSIGTVGGADGRRIAVAALVLGHVLVDAAQPGYRLDAVPAIRIAGF